MNSPIDELTLFASIQRPQQFMQWLEAERAKAFKTLSMERDLVGLHQAQGKVHLLDRMIALLENARGH